MKRTNHSANVSNTRNLNTSGIPLADKSSASKKSKWGPKPSVPPEIRTSARVYANPVDYDHPYESMARFADFLVLRYDATSGISEQSASLASLFRLGTFRRVEEHRSTSNLTPGISQKTGLLSFLRNHAPNTSAIERHPRPFLHAAHSPGLFDQRRSCWLRFAPQQYTLQSSPFCLPDAIPAEPR